MKIGLPSGLRESTSKSRCSVIWGYALPVAVETECLNVGVVGIVLVDKKGAKNFLLVVSDSVVITSGAPSLAATILNRHYNSGECLLHGRCIHDKCTANATYSNGYCDQHRECFVDGCHHYRHYASGECVLHGTCIHDKCTADATHSLGYCDAHYKCSVDGCLDSKRSGSTFCRRHNPRGMKDPLNTILYVAYLKLPDSMPEEKKRALRETFLVSRDLKMMKTGHAASIDVGQLSITSHGLRDRIRCN
jgi:hypothetical protein